ncbi:MAG TPA: dienelactone hydrolase family protein [Bryobacteraceae bacterium]|nr:dienelactone hydrolase family protein [Bryobacteraceae bacterium]
MISTYDRAVEVSLGRITLAADISIPSEARGVVVFAHGSGSGRHSPRNRLVADVLKDGDIATILIDLLTEQEESVDLETAELRFDIGLLAGRLVAISDWTALQPRLKKLGLGYFGASTGAAAALVAASERPKDVQAVVSRGGRPDLAGDALRSVVTPTLFIVGGRDAAVLDLNYSAIARLPQGTEHRLEIVRGATHLFEEPGTLDQVAILARDWFRTHLKTLS